jgi:predicted patatin/cPLA2 family phospholipase
MEINSIFLYVAFVIQFNKNMEKTKIALVLQGGAVRGAFTAGVLDVFMENNLYFPYVVGVSAGALIALNYLSKQIGRSRSVVVDFMSDKNFVSGKFLFTKKSLFNFDYLFGEMATNVLPFDFEAFQQSPSKLVVAATSCLTGQPNYYIKGECDDFYKAIAASSSLPFLSAPVFVEGEPCLDGGLSTPIPFQKAFADGYERIVVITTRDKEYRKNLNKKQHKTALKALYGKYPNLINTVLKYPAKYNEDASELEGLEKEGKAFVIRPEIPILLKRTEKDKSELLKVYLLGRKVASELLPKLIEYMNDE